MAYYVISEEGLVAKTQRIRIPGGGWKHLPPAWVPPYKHGGTTSIGDAEKLAAEMGGQVVTDRDPRIVRAIAEWTADFDRKSAEAAAAEAARKAAYVPYDGADTLREALGDWD